MIESVVEGLARGCREGNCALLGGETAEMPGFYSDGEYDIAGFIVGVVDKSKVIDGSRITAGRRSTWFALARLAHQWIQPRTQIIS